MKTINIANFGRRLFAAIIDGVIFIFLFLVLMVFVMNPIVNSTMGLSDNMTLGYQYQTASHLYVLRQVIDSSSGDEIAIEVKDYSEEIVPNAEKVISSINELNNKDSTYYLEHLRYYYLSYKTGENIELPNDIATKKYDMVEDNFVAPNYQDIVIVNEISGLPRDIFTSSWFNINILNIGTSEAIYYLDENNEYKITDEFKNRYSDASKSEEDNNLNIEKEAIKYLNEKIYYAQKDLYEQNFYQEVNKNVENARLVMGLVPYFISMLLVYLLFPLIFKNGETLGKKMNHICLVNKNGYKVSKPQVLLRFLVFLCEMSLSTFIVGYGFTSIATLGVGIVILMILTLVNKNKRALHDFAALTMVIDERTSVFFKNVKEEEEKEKEIEENMEKYRSRKVIDKHLIQIGSEIIDEKIKEEYLKNKQE